MTGRRVAPGAVLVGVLAGSLLTGCTGAGTDDGVRPAGAQVAAAAATSADRMVWVSGRDDHGMVAEESVAVYDGPDGSRVVGRVPDGTLAHVLSTDGQWLRIRTADGRPVTGWIDDFFLRGQVRLVGAAPGCAVELSGRWQEGGALVVVRDLRGDRARVESVADPDVRGWVLRSDLQELPPQGPRCGDVPLDDRHAHQH